MANATMKRNAKVVEYSGPKTKICPRCGKPGKVRERFGYRVTGGVTRAQSYCLTCRGIKQFVEMTVIAVDEKPKTKAKKQATPAVTTELNEQIGLDVELTRHVFQKHFPNDKQKRGWKLMATRLVKKCGKGILSPEAYTELAI